MSPLSSFFFQAEDGIRDHCVTGVQTCALPILIISCQGGDYTNEVHPRLRAAGWNGYWIDAASALRMNHDAVIILDPVNMPLIKQAIADGTRNFIGGKWPVGLEANGQGGVVHAH